MSVELAKILGIDEKQFISAPQWLKDYAHRMAAGTTTEIDRLLTEPEFLFTKIGRPPDPWQVTCLRSKNDLMLNVSRQCGKSFVTSAIALLYALAMPPALIIIISPSERQSGELINAQNDKFPLLYEPWRKLCPLVKDNESEKVFANGSRLIALPGKSDANVRGYSNVTLLIMDEASRIPDSMYDAITPVLIVGGGRKIALSTPFGKRGWFYKEWTEGKDWQKIALRADQNERLKKMKTKSGANFLEVEKQSKGWRVYEQEYMCSFNENVGAVFREEDISAAFVSNIEGFEPIEFDPPKFVETVYLDDSYKIEMPS